jgi:4-nitrophenyl phosphatase
VVAKLARMGVPATPRDVVTSAMAAAWLLAQSLPAGARVLVCAGPGVREALAEVGLVAVDAGPADAVVVGFHREFDYDGLDRASAAVRAGARFVATNMDATYPVPGGLIPGAGALVAAVATAAGRRPEVAGKPEAPTVGIIRERFGTSGVVVGDRPSTDGALATALGWPFALVLSGVTAAVAPPGGEAIPEPPPPFVCADLGALAPALITALAP